MATVEVEETGPGFADVPRAINPFCTTKPVGRGTGLGLSICYGIVTNHGGEIYAENQPTGARVTVRLPFARRIEVSNMFLSGAEREEMFAIASDEANRLSHLTTEFLDYASIRTPTLTETLVGELADYVADASRAHASMKGIRFEVQEADGIKVRADEGQLQQALMNLLLNAVDASLAGGKVLVRVQKADHRVQIDVENGGAPIEEPILGRIFEPFFTTKPHGTGLGLAIARNIARAQGGDLVLSLNQTNHVCFSLILWAANDGNR
jgi:signal transduction histidine kinase